MEKASEELSGNSQQSREQWGDPTVLSGKPRKDGCSVDQKAAESSGRMRVQQAMQKCPLRKETRPAQQGFLRSEAIPACSPVSRGQGWRYPEVKPILPVNSLVTDYNDR